MDKFAIGHSIADKFIQVDGARFYEYTYTSPDSIFTGNESLVYLFYRTV